MPHKQIKRNGHAFHPIMKKGGAHGKSKKAQRKAAKHNLQKNTQEWLGRSFYGCKMRLNILFFRVWL